MSEHNDKPEHEQQKYDVDHIKKALREMPAEAPVPSQTEARLPMAVNPWDKPKMVYGEFDPQAAQTVASPTADVLRKLGDNLSRYILSDLEYWREHGKHDAWLLLTITQRRVMPAIRDYAATLEARVAAQKNIIATLGEGKAAAEERAEKVEARVRELERQIEGAVHSYQNKEACWNNRILSSEHRANALAVSLRDAGETLKERGNSSYRSYVETMRSRPCLGFQTKMEKAEFGQENLSAFVKAGEFLGKNAAFYEAHALLSRLSTQSENKS